MKQVMEDEPTATQLVESFRDAFDRMIVPSALIVREDAQIPRQIDSLSSFRNATAMCFVLRARAALLSNRSNQIGAAWTDVFDFHPAEVDKKGRIQINSAALFDIVGRPLSLRFAPAPFLSRALDIHFCDARLTRLLSTAWKECFIYRRRINDLRPIFRSLEVAFQAANVPIKNEGSLYDFGLAVAHWVSALETLLWPVNNRANQSQSLNYLALVSWPSEILNAKNQSIWRAKRKEPGTATQKACQLMYSARNAFLHGEMFEEQHLVPFPDRPAAVIHFVAAVVYRAALVNRLTEMFPGDPNPKSRSAVKEQLGESIFVQALKSFFGLDEPAA